MKRLIVIAALAAVVGCDDHNSSDRKQQEAQEKLLDEGSSQVGMPAIKNFRERKILKDIYELRDQTGLTTYTYVFSEQTGKLSLLGESIGYGIPCATQFTNPSKIEYRSDADKVGQTYQVLPQADPNGLFSPTSAEGTWVLLKDPNGKDVRPVYIEPRIVVSPFKLPDALLQR